MMKNKTDKRPLREDIRLVWRSVKLWQEIIPGMWTVMVFCVLVETFSPYFGLYMSARLVNELAGQRDPATLASLAAVTVIGTLTLALLERFLESRRDLKEHHMVTRQFEYLSYVRNGFKFEYTEDPETVQKGAEIEAVGNAFGGGLCVVRNNVEFTLISVLNVILSTSLAVSMFTLHGSGGNGRLMDLLDSPAASVLLAALICTVAYLETRIAAVYTVKTSQALDGLPYENIRRYAFMKNVGTDMTLFSLNRIVLDELRAQMRPKWIKQGEKATIWCDCSTTLLTAVLDIAVFIFVAGRAFAGAFGIGSFILYQGAVTRFVEGISSVASGLGNLRYNGSRLEELFQYLDLPNDMYMGTLAVEKRDDLDYEIEFRDVSFKYPRTDTWALRHVSMRFNIGKKLAIVGENGSGKTTFIKLLCRLYDPTEGRILLNGIDITRYRYSEYMGLFSVVFQDYTLFDFPLGDNVAASMDYDSARVRDCLTRAGLGEKLAQLDVQTGGSGGLTVSVGRDYDSGGVDLSGGERQKTALARALYKDAPFVILDEPTAALDPIAEAAVYEDFNKIAQDKTTVFISHRLSSCKFCDEILVFHRGTVIQQGTHESLEADTGGKYHQLWQAQAKYYVNK